MEARFERTAMLVGDDAVETLKRSSVAVFGIGGVGSYVVEALARAGVGKLLLVDNDTVSESNINRQLVALHSTVGRLKVDVAAERVRDINPDCKAQAKALFYLPETADEIDLSVFDYVVDAVDNVTAKIELIKRCHDRNVPIISSMGTGNKLDPTRFEVADIQKTSVCPLARVMRRELKNRGIRKCKVVYSKEEPVLPAGGGPRVPASISFVPSAAGLVIAGEVIKDLIK